jgi:hypothetical protein
MDSDLTEPDSMEPAASETEASELDTIELEAFETEDSEPERAEADDDCDSRVRRRVTRPIAKAAHMTRTIPTVAPGDTPGELEALLP